MSDTNNNIITLAEIGSQFHEARVHRGVLIEDVAKTLKISSKILRAIEDGNRDELPQLVFLRGFVKSYGLFLGFPETDLQKALMYLEESEPKATFVTPTPEQKPFYSGEVQSLIRLEQKRKIIRGILIVLVAIVVVMLSLYLFSNNIVIEEPITQQVQTEELSVETAPEITSDDDNLEEVVVSEEGQNDNVAQLAGEVEAGGNSTDIIVPTPTAAEIEQVEETIEPTAQETAPIEKEEVSAVNEEVVNEAELFEPPVKFQRIGFFGGGDESLVVQAVEDCWLTFTIDGSVATEGEVVSREAFLRRGQEMLLSFNKDLTMRLGNAGGIEVILNGKNIGSPGRSGQVKSVTYTSAGMQ